MTTTPTTPQQAGALSETRGYHALRSAIESLREFARYEDEEGEDTDALEELANAIATAATDSAARAAPSNLVDAAAVDVAVARGESEAFEAWAEDQGFPLQRTLYGAGYQDLRTQGAWDAWQARAALTRASVDAVPVAYVPRAHADSEHTIVGEFAWSEVSEKPFECNDPSIWECVALTIAANAQTPVTTKGFAGCKECPDEPECAYHQCCIQQQYAKAAANAQAPVATLHDDGHWTWKGSPPYESNYAGWRMEVYAAPAQPAVVPVAVYQIEQAPGRWTDVDREVYGLWQCNKRIVCLPAPAAAQEGVKR